MNLGKVIKEIRKQKGIRQNAFADLCKVSQAYLSQIESNSKEPNMSILKEIAKQLNTPLPFLFFLSLDESDIPENKKHVFQVLNPTIKTLITEFLSNE